MRPGTETDWCELAYMDTGLEQVFDAAAADPLMPRIAVALATSTAHKGRAQPGDGGCDRGQAGRGGW